MGGSLRYGTKSSLWVSLWWVISCHLESAAATPGRNTSPCHALASRWQLANLFPKYWSTGNSSFISWHPNREQAERQRHVDDDGNGAAEERGLVEDVEKGGGDRSGGRTSRISWWRRPKREDRVLWRVLVVWRLSSQRQVQKTMEEAARKHCTTTRTGRKERFVDRE